MNLYSVVTIKTDEKGDVLTTHVHGIFDNREHALKIIENNLGDVFEYYYDYAIVEEFKTGLYPMVCILKWIKLLDYKDSRAILEEVDCPENFKNRSGFTF